MELVEAVLARRMCRSFSDGAVPTGTVDRLLGLAQRAPSAGNTQGWQWLVLDTPDDVARYWDVTLPAARRPTFPWPGLLRAPVLVVPYARPAAYVARYGEADKLARPAASGGEKAALSAGADGWPVPYWFVDAGMAVMTLLLGAIDAGLGACLFGQFEHEAAVREAFGVPEGFRAVGTIALGVADGADRPSRSAGRRRPPLEDVVHRGGWRAGPEDERG